MARRNRSESCVIVSFIGKTDLKAFDILPSDRSETSPIERLLTDDTVRRNMDPARSRLILFDDDPPECDERQRFCEELEAALEEWDLQGMTVERVPLPGIKSDREKLYEGVWKAIPQSGGYGRYIFHVSSGAFPMQATLFLAAATFPFPPGSQVDIYETSREEGVKQLALPYVLGLRAAKERERSEGRLTLEDEARRKLQPHTVAEDPEVQHAYAVLYQTAQRWHEVAGKGTSLEGESVLIKGPCGCGKWHAARQLAHWSERTLQVCGGPDELPQAPEPGTLLGIRRLETWDEAALRRLRHWRDQHPQMAVVATWRTDRPPQTDLQTAIHEGLDAPVEVLLPALEIRSDIRELVKALAAWHGIPTGKIDELFQYEAMAHFPAGLHDLERLVVNSHAYRNRKTHPDEKGRQRAKRQLSADAALDALWQHYQALCALRFGGNQPNLKERLDAIKRAIVVLAETNGRTQRQIADFLGESKSAVDRILKQATGDGFGST